MKKKRNRFLSCLLTVTMLAGSFPQAAFAAEPEGDAVVWEEEAASENTVDVSGSETASGDFAEASGEETVSVNETEAEEEESVSDNEADPSDEPVSENEAEVTEEETASENEAGQEKETVSENEAEESVSANEAGSADNIDDPEDVELYGDSASTVYYEGSLTVKIGGKSVKYQNDDIEVGMQAAAAAKSALISLDTDVTVKNKVLLESDGGSVVLDLKGHSLTATGDEMELILVKNGTCSIKGDGSIVTDGYRGILYGDHTDLELADTDLQAKNAFYAVMVFEGSLTIEDSSIRLEAHNAEASITDEVAYAGVYGTHADICLSSTDIAVSSEVLDLGEKFTKLRMYDIWSEHGTLRIQGGSCKLTNPTIQGSADTIYVSVGNIISLNTDLEIVSGNFDVKQTWNTGVIEAVSGSECNVANIAAGVGSVRIGYGKFDCEKEVYGDEACDCRSYSIYSNDVDIDITDGSFSADDVAVMPYGGSVCMHDGWLIAPVGIQCKDGFFTNTEIYGGTILAQQYGIWYPEGSYGEIDMAGGSIEVTVPDAGYTEGEVSMQACGILYQGQALESDVIHMRGGSIHVTGGTAACSSPVSQYTSDLAGIRLDGGTESNALGLGMSGGEILVEAAAVTGEPQNTVIRAAAVSLDSYSGAALANGSITARRAAEEDEVYAVLVNEACTGAFAADHMVLESDGIACYDAVTSGKKRTIQLAGCSVKGGEYALYISGTKDLLIEDSELTSSGVTIVSAGAGDMTGGAITLRRSRISSAGNSALYVSPEKSGAGGDIILEACSVSGAGGIYTSSEWISDIYVTGTEFAIEGTDSYTFAIWGSGPETDITVKDSSFKLINPDNISQVSAVSGAGNIYVSDTSIRISGGQGGLCVGIAAGPDYASCETVVERVTIEIETEGFDGYPSAGIIDSNGKLTVADSHIRVSGGAVRAIELYKRYTGEVVEMCLRNTDMEAEGTTATGIWDEMTGERTLWNCTVRANGSDEGTAIRQEDSGTESAFHLNGCELYATDCALSMGSASFALLTDSTLSSDVYQIEGNGTVSLFDGVRLEAAADKPVTLLLGTEEVTGAALESRLGVSFCDENGSVLSGSELEGKKVLIVCDPDGMKPYMEIPEGLVTTSDIFRIKTDAEGAKISSGTWYLDGEELESGTTIAADYCFINETLLNKHGGFGEHMLGWSGTVGKGTSTRSYMLQEVVSFHPKVSFSAAIYYQDGSGDLILADTDTSAVFANGSGEITQVCAYGEALTVPECPTLEGYVFAYWARGTEKMAETIDDKLYYYLEKADPTEFCVTETSMASTTKFYAVFVPEGLWLDPSKISLDTSTGKAMLTGSDPWVYTGSAITPLNSDRYVLYYGLQQLTAKDYKVSYKKNTDAGTALATITGKGSYTGKLQAYFTIEAKSIAENITQINNGYADSADTLYNKYNDIYAYTGKTIKLSKQLYDPETKKTLKEGKDYTIRILKDSKLSAMIEAGSYTVCYDGINNYTGTLEVAVEVRELTSLSKLKFSKIAAQSYTGSAIEPAVVVKNGKNIVDSSEYTVAYRNNTACGTAQAIIYGNEKANGYTGYKVIPFKIGGDFHCL